jgi:hypothetical protein
MQKLIDISAVHTAEVELIRKQSALLLQKRKDGHGFDGELHSSGALVENYVKALLRKHVPAGYRICSGYIATADTFGDAANHAQHDIIIADDRIPALYRFGISDIEIVPAEAVCAVIEVKRKLTQSTLSAAIEHLRETKLLLDEYDSGIKSKVRSLNNALGVTLGIATHAPMYAVIGLDAEKDVCEKVFFSDVTTPAIVEFLDLVWSPSAPYVAGFNLRSTVDGTECTAINVSRYQPPYEAKPFSEGFDGASATHVHQVALWAIRTWLNNTSGAGMSPRANMKYFGLA